MKAITFAKAVSFGYFYLLRPAGEPDGEMGASMRYLSQRYAMPYGMQKAVLTDIGTEEPEMFRSGANAFFDAFATV